MTGGFSHQTDNRLAGFSVVPGTIDFSRQHRLESGSFGNCHCELTPRDSCWCTDTDIDMAFSDIDICDIDADICDIDITPT